MLHNHKTIVSVTIPFLYYEIYVGCDSIITKLLLSGLNKVSLYIAEMKCQISHTFASISGVDHYSWSWKNKIC